MRRRTFLASLSAATASPADGFWSRQQTGANCFNRRVTPKWIAAAQQAGIRLVRLAYDKWSARDFLLGSADSYQGLVAPDLKMLVSVLDSFARARMRVILTPLSLPGARWRQNNGGRRDGRIWKDLRFHDQAARFWRDLAGTLKGHPAVAALDLLNEPAPELDAGPQPAPGSAGDLNAFHEALLAFVRAVDSSVPVLIESGMFASPLTFTSLRPLPDAAVLYSFHMYEPYEYTTWRRNKGTLRFPGMLPVEENGPKSPVDAAWLDRYLDPVRAWAKQHGIQRHRIVASEFGCGRRCAGAAEYLAALLRILDREQWHWLFYSFREDVWDGMDYELGPAPPPAWYWELAENGRVEQRYAELYGPRAGNPLWAPLASRLRGA